MKSKKGQILVGVLVMLVVLAILVPTMVKYVRNESSWSEKQRQNSNAFQLAEAAVDRGYRKIAESTSTWKEIQDGIPQPGFMFDLPYDDLEGGTYAISLSSGPDNNQVTILAVGRDKQKKEVRALKVIYAKGTVDSAMYANGIDIGGNVKVEWGPMKSRGNILLSGTPPSYPRKYAVGSITGWGTISPCTDNKEFWAYNCSPGVPPPPKVDIKGYEDLAKATKCPASWAAGASPAGSCYWPGNVSLQNNPDMSSAASSTTIYAHGDISLQNIFIIGSVISDGNVTINGNGKGVYHIPSNNASMPEQFTGGIPSTSWMEYKKIDTENPDDYYGDAGNQVVSSGFDFVSGGGTPAKGVGIKNVNPTVRGFIYAGNVFDAVGSGVVHGVIMCPKGISNLHGSLTVFYDNKVASAIMAANSYPTRVLWQDSRQPWPSTLP